MKKKIIIAVIACAAIAAAAGAYLIARKYVAPPPIVGELKVISYSPQGEDVPISADGVAVMFNRAVVPLTTIDSGRSRGIDLKITPAVSGKFFWLGTHGFIFRPDEPLTPATKYKVEMPAGLVSIDGYRLDAPLAWEFTTVLPSVWTWEPADGQTLLPKDATIFVRFNVAMNRSDVESKLAIADANSNQPIENKPEFTWGEDGHTLTMRFKNDMPWNATLKMTLPKGTLADKGDIGTAEDVSVSYTTPPKEMTLEKVDASSPENLGSDERSILQPGKTKRLRTGAGICFAFSQSIEKKSFERALHVELSGASRESKNKLQPYYYFEESETFPTVGDDGRTKYKEGYKRGCAVFLDEAGSKYEFSIDPSKIESLSGARLSGGEGKYVVATKHAEPEVRSLLTKNIISLNGPMKIPYRATNVSSAQLRLYKWSGAYNESLKDAHIEGVDPKTSPPMSLPLVGEEVRLPIDPDTLTIDQSRMPADEVYDVPIEAKQDQSTRFLINLADLQHKPAPGIYLMEVTGSPSVVEKGDNPPAAVYSMIQVTPVAIAMKRDSDRVVVWTTDIESGAPAANLAVRVVAKKWGDQASKWVTAGEKTGVTDDKGVAVIALQTQPDARVCAEVTAKGNESLSCEDEHQIGEYASTIAPGKHYYAYVYTDRPIYRPGQKVFFSSFVREVREGRYFMPGEGTSVSVQATDAAGQTIFEQADAKIESGGVVSGSFEISGAEDVSRGEYTIALDIDKQRMSRAFVVSSYRKPSFKVDVKAQKDEIISNDPLVMDVVGSYFFGAPLKGAAAHWSIMTSTYLFAPEGYYDYSFIDEDLLRKTHADENGDMDYMSDYEYDVVADSGSSAVKYDEDQSQYEDPRSPSSSAYSTTFFSDPGKKDMSSVPAKLDDKGALVIKYTPNLGKYPTSQILSVEASITDPSQQEVSGSEDVIVHKAAFYLGVKPKKWVYGAKEKAGIDVVSLDTAGKPAGGKSFTMDVVRREYKYIERRNARGYWDLVFEPKDTKLATLDGKTDGNGATSLAYQLPQGGEYRFVTHGKDGSGNEVQSATTIFAWGEGYVPWRLDKPEKIELVADKESYKVGETAKILVKSLVPVTKALLALQRGHVLEYRVIDLGGNASHFELPIAEGMIPNLYVSIVAHVGRNAEHPPLLYSGDVELRVEPERKRLDVALATDRKGEKDTPPIYRPGDEVKVRIKTTDADGKPHSAHVIVSVADESVLKLLNYKLPDLVKKFYYQRPDSVITSSSMISLKAGDGGLAAGKRRRIFKDTAFFAANVTTDDKGEAEVSFKLPDDLTTWVIEALGITESKTTKEFEAELAQSAPETPQGQRAVGANLSLTDGTFVGSARAKVMSTLPVVVRTALPRFAAWGDELTAKIIANNRTAEKVSGTISVTVSGDGLLKGDKPSQNIDFSIPANTEQAFPVDVSIRSAGGRLGLTADAKDAKGAVLDSLEVGIPVKDRYAPEVVATSGMTKAAEREAVDLPKGTEENMGGLDVTMRASIALAAAPSLRNLIYFPWGCSEQKSATLMALLMARDMTERFGEGYFDALAPIAKEKIEEAKSLSAKKELLDDQIDSIIKELFATFQQYDGGMRYWPESSGTDYFASAQVLAALAMAKAQGIEFDEAARVKLKGFVAGKIKAKTKEGKYILGADDRAYGLWAMTLDKSRETIDANEWKAQLSELSVSGLSYLIMAAKNGGASMDLGALKGRLLAEAKQEPRSMSWPASEFFWSSAMKNTALAGLALLTADPNDPSVPRAMDFILNRKKVAPCNCTQDNLYVSMLTTAYAQVAKEEDTDFTASVQVGKKELIEKSFSRENLTEVGTAAMPMKELMELSMPAEIKVEKKGDGTLYYDMVLKYYLPPDKAPTREEGLIISREYYALDDVKETKPLTEFKSGENYKGHITIMLPQEMNYVVVQDLLPAGFEAIDMNLATSSHAAEIEARGDDEISRNAGNEAPQYDDVIPEIDYGMNFAFRHQEVRDDSIVWSDEAVPPGVYHIKYPVRATTAGKFLMPGAVAFEFYRPEIFGRGRARTIEIKE